MNTVLKNPRFKTWKTIKIGTGVKTGAGFCKAIRDTGMWIDIAEGAIRGITETIAKQESEIDLVVVSIAELCLDGNRTIDDIDDYTTINDIYVRAQDVGLGICSAEVGPQLRLQYKDQPKGEGLVIASKLLVDDDGDPCLSYLGRRGDHQWIEVLLANPEKRWHPNSLFVFLQKK